MICLSHVGKQYMFCSTLFCFILGRLFLRFWLHSGWWSNQNVPLTAYLFLNLWKKKRNINDFGPPTSRPGHLWVLSGRHLCDPKRPQKQTESHLKVTSGHSRSPKSSSSGFQSILKGLWRVFWTSRGFFWGLTHRLGVAWATFFWSKSCFCFQTSGVNKNVSFTKSATSLWETLCF